MHPFTLLTMPWNALLYALRREHEFSFRSHPSSNNVQRPILSLHQTGTGSHRLFSRGSDGHRFGFDNPLSLENVANRYGGWR